MAKHTQSEPSLFEIDQTKAVPSAPPLLCEVPLSVSQPKAPERASDVPTVACPKCGIEREDHDWFGVLYCASCGYCQHPTIEVVNGKDVCQLCNKTVSGAGPAATPLWDMAVEEPPKEEPKVATREDVKDLYAEGLSTGIEIGKAVESGQRVAEAQKPTYPSAMHQTALVFLDEPIARRLAVAWTTCGGSVEDWFEAAGLSKGNLDATQMSKVLRINGICREGGVTDALALQYIHALIARPLGQARKRGKD